MTSYQSDFLHTMATRGFIHQLTDADGLDAAAKKGALAGYIGFDATAPSLHVGSLVQIMMLRWLQKTGGRPIVVMGGGTTKVGDPSGKDEARQLRPVAEINANMASQRQIFERLLTFGPDEARMVNNADWLDGLNYIDFLRDYGRHFSVNRMLSFDSVKLRLEREQPLSFIEFNYMVMQAYDFLELSRRYGCTLQMGGSDQWGNIVSGIELTRRCEGTPLFGLTTPLLTTASGTKMGKTAKGAIWLNADQLSVYDYWQFWRNTDDADVARFLKLFTDLPLDEITKLAALGGAEINEAKKILATQATTLAHGLAAAKAAAATAQTTFESSGMGEDLPTLTTAQPITLLDALLGLGMAASRGEARRLITQGGARINNIPVTDESALLTPESDPVKISAGKKRHGLVKMG